MLYCMIRDFIIFFFLSLQVESDVKKKQNIASIVVNVVNKAL